MLGLFVNTLTVDDKYSRHNRENFPQQIQTTLSQKQRILSILYIAFLKSTSNFDYFETKDGSHSLSISEIIDCEEVR